MNQATNAGGRVPELGVPFRRARKSFRGRNKPEARKLTEEEHDTHVKRQRAAAAKIDAELAEKERRRHAERTNAQQTDAAHIGIGGQSVGAAPAQQFDPHVASAPVEGVAHIKEQKPETTSVTPEPTTDTLPGKTEPEVKPSPKAKKSGK